MTSLAVSDNFVILCSALGATVLAKSSEQTKKVVLTLPKQCDNKKKNANSDCDSDIGRVIIKISHSEKYFAVCSGKKLSIWVTKDWTLLNSRDVARAASSIVFTHSEKHIVLADKSGDVYTFNITEQEPGQLILGHLSVVLETLVTSDDKFILTCDRDEKIRVSNFPNAYNIHCFCLGHKEFVSSIKFLPHDENILLSGSGDGTVKCWRFSEGLELLSYSLSALPSDIISSVDNSLIAVNNIEVLQKNDKSSLICLSIPQVPKIIILLIESNNDQLVCNYHSFIDLNTEPIIFDISKDHLWILSGETVAQLTVHQWCDDEEKFTKRESVIDNLLADVDVDLQKILCLPKKQDSIEYLYKKKYDNVQEYLVKKKARIEASL